MVMRMASVSAVFAPVPDFRYVGLEPVTVPGFRSVATSLGLGAGVTLALSGLDARHALAAGALASIASAFALRGTGKARPADSAARMAIVPWGVLVHAVESPRILRWPAVRRIGVETSRAHHLLSGVALSSRVVIETEHERFVGETVGAVALDRLVDHLDAYADEQCTPIALDLVGDDGSTSLETAEPGFEPLLAAARDWLATAGAVVRLGLAPAGYRRAGSLVSTPVAVDVLGEVLGDRTPRAADPRAFAAVLAAELRAVALVPALVALTQCPHPLVAAVAKQAARKLGATGARTGTLDEVAPFLLGADPVGLEAWG